MSKKTDRQQSRVKGYVAAAQQTSRVSGSVRGFESLDDSSAGDFFCFFALDFVCVCVTSFPRGEIS
jgi:hypothetical protein